MFKGYYNTKCKQKNETEKLNCLFENATKLSNNAKNNVKLKIQNGKIYK